MESPVRICLGAALVVSLLLLSSTPANGNALPHDPITTIKDERTPRHTRNTTWVKPKTPDVASNELNPKSSVSEENTDKNAKYKDRGRIRFGASIKSSTESPYRRTRTKSTSTTQATKDEPTLIIVTPTPEVKKPAQIINSMRNYKKTKMPVVASSTPSLPVSAKNEVKSDSSEEYDEEDDHGHDHKESFEEITSSKFDTNFFTIPNYEHDFGHDSEAADNKVRSEYSKKPYDTFSSYFPEINFSKDDQHDEPFKTDSFFNFDTELTTPKHDFFDKKYEQISQSIIKNLDAMKTKAEPTNATIYKLEKQRADLEKLGELKDDEIMDKQGNKSTVFIKNTKEIRLLDNEGAGTTNQALSDNVQGTSIYYEKMSVLSTETYNMSHSDEDDCDNDALPAEPTVSTSSEQELASFKSTQPTFITTMPYEPTNEYVSTSYSNFLPFSSIGPSYFSSVSPHPYPTQNSLSPTDKIKVYTSSFTRNRNYSKRLNLTGANESPNSLTRTVPPTSVSNHRLSTRKFHFTTPKTKPIWMAPRRNVTRTSYPKSTPPTTIYSEHFSIKDRTTKPIQPHRTSLTTVSSEIDPIIEGDVDNVKKIVHSASVSDNSIPSLWKRGSTKFTASTVASSEANSGVSDMEIPPTLTAWALASLRSPPSMPSPTATLNATAHKKVEENELQKFKDVADTKKETTTNLIPTTAANSINIDNVSNKLIDIDQNKLPWKPVPAPTVPSSYPTSTESKSESLPAESNINIQSSIKPVYSAETNADSTEASNAGSTDDKKWVSATEAESSTTKEINDVEGKIPPVDATKSTGFESITKLPAGMTTPQEEIVESSSTDSTKETVPTTTDYDVTTIRFSYKPTEVELEPETEKIPASTWHPVFPTRTRMTTEKETIAKATTVPETTVKDEPVTTYRPTYKTTTDTNYEISTMSTETTVMLEVSTVGQTVETSENASTESVQVRTTDKSTTNPATTSTKTVPVDTTTMPTETPTMVVQVVTEINTEREKPTARTEVSMSTEVSSSSEMTETTPEETKPDSSSEQNSGSNEVITKEPRTSPSVTTRAAEITTKTDPVTQEQTTTSKTKEETTQSGRIIDTANSTDTEEAHTDGSSISEDSSTVSGDVTTEAIILTDEAGSGAAIAIAVSTIGVIALIMLVGLLLVVRRRGRQGVYAQRCTPVSLDAYSLDSVSVGPRKGNPRLRASKRSYGNPAYDDEVTSHPMQYAALANFALDIESMNAEFTEIPSVTVRPDEVPPGCEDKNRYSNVLPLPETRVPLSRINNDPTSEYINANYITGPGNIKNYYIACQAPLPNTVDDFWRMIWEQNSRLIVMLTEYMENGVEKCYEYLPPSEVSDNKRTFGDYQIILTKREQHDKYAVSTVQLVNLNTRTWREITHLWYFWPAKGVPDDYESVIDFLAEMRSYMKISQTAKEYDEEGIEVIYGDGASSLHNLSKLRSDEAGSGNGVNVYSPAKAEEQLKRTNGTLARIRNPDVEGVRPCVVTCASGAGRSAAMIAADICARALTAAAADVPRVVRELRAQRPHSLSNRHHYIFLYKLLAEYGNKLMGGVDTI